ncbi:MAG TPA: thioredoxin family protein [Paludibacteraceae bacterium]|nr:thioredoxin family protein [Paludibacteraceae bacterium]HPL94793.1 thioredoxin family protein [Paludibacteraceae bacterium]
MEIKVLGPGCPKCKSLEKLVQETVQEMQLDATITKVEDIMEIMQYNIIATPALVINGKVVLKGVLPSKVQLQIILSTN